MSDDSDWVKLTGGLEANNRTGEIRPIHKYTVPSRPGYKPYAPAIWDPRSLPGNGVVDEYQAMDQGPEIANFLWDGGNSGPYSYQRFEPLKAECFYCEKEIVASHHFVHDKDAYEVRMKCLCCQREEKKLFTQGKINEINNAGKWLAFLS